MWRWLTCTWAVPFVAKRSCLAKWHFITLYEAYECLYIYFYSYDGCVSYILFVGCRMANDTLAIILRAATMSQYFKFVFSGLAS